MKNKAKKYLYTLSLLVIAILFLTACIGGANTGGMRSITGIPDFSNHLSSAGHGRHVPTDYEFVSLPDGAEVIEFKDGFIVYSRINNADNFYTGVVDVRNGDSYTRVLSVPFAQLSMPHSTISVYGDYNFRQLIFVLNLDGRYDSRSLYNTDGQIIELLCIGSFVAHGERIVIQGAYIVEDVFIYVLNEVNVIIDRDVWRVDGNQATRVICNAPQDIVAIGDRLWSDSERVLFNQDGDIIYAGRSTGTGLNYFADRFIILSDVRGAYITHRRLPHTSRDYDFICELGNKYSQIIEVVAFANGALSRVNNFSYDLRFAHFSPMQLNIRGACLVTFRYFELESSAQSWTFIYNTRKIQNSLSLNRRIDVAINDRFTTQQSFKEYIQVLRRNRFLVSYFDRVTPSINLMDSVGGTIASFRQAKMVGNNVISAQNGYYNFDGARIFSTEQALEAIEGLELQAPNNMRFGELVDYRYIGTYFLVRHRFGVGTGATAWEGDLVEHYQYILANRNGVARLVANEVHQSLECLAYGIYIVRACLESVAYVYNVSGELLFELAQGKELINEWLISFSLNRGNVRDFSRYGIIRCVDGVVGDTIVRFR